MEHEIWVVVDVETGLFYKKYSWKGFRFNQKPSPELYLTKNLGASRVYHTQGQAHSAWARAVDTGIVKIVCMSCKEKTPD